MTPSSPELNSPNAHIFADTFSHTCVLQCFAMHTLAGIFAEFLTHMRATMQQCFATHTLTGGEDRARLLLARLPHKIGAGSVSESKSAAVYDTLFKR